ncbi:hypothetical protein KY285_023627 [Solanum tuberosum]|nr:hypothetical protein KY289_023958 [Solanum tuberosum]KAH0675826.1 hypothetical protein KY285_023627 [Solanum tuberosum]
MAPSSSSTGSTTTSTTQILSDFSLEIYDKRRAGAWDDKGNPIIRNYYSSPLTASGNTHDDMLLAKLETVNTGSGEVLQWSFVFNMDQGLPVWSEWLVFNRVNARARKDWY